MHPRGYSPPPPYVQVAPTSGLATGSLVAGVLSILGAGCLLVPAVVAVVLGHLALRETRSGRRGGHGLAVGGLVLGYLCLAGWAALAVFFGAPLVMSAVMPPPE